MLKSKFLVVLFLSIIVLLPIFSIRDIVSFAAAEEQTQSAGTTFQNATVGLANSMITNGSFPDLVLLDVRFQCEYNMGHLNDAILIPYDELETKIDELEEHKNHEIIVYCRSGFRSQIACEILAEHNFTKIYNMLGGILAWIDADYSIWTTSHHVSVGIVNEEISLQIEPLLLHQTGCFSCAPNQTCPSGNGYINITSIILEQDENHTVTLVTYEVNGTSFEVTIVKTVLWSYEELTDNTNRTARFISTEVATENMSTQFYNLCYHAQHAEHNLTVYTDLSPLNSETYNSSFTTMSYKPIGEPEVLSFELVEFNLSITLSKQYTILGKVAKEIGKLYEKSGDTTLAQLAIAYYKMENEAKNLAKLVEKQLTQHDNMTLTSLAIIRDPVGGCDINPCLNGGGGGEPPPCDWECLIDCALQDPESVAQCTVSCLACLSGFIPLCVPCLICILVYSIVGYLCMQQCGC